MKIKEEKRKKFDSVKMMREIRDRIDQETQGMNFEQLKEYYRESVQENRKRVVKSS